MNMVVFLAIYNNQEKPIGIIGAGEYGGSLGIHNNQGKLVGGIGATQYGGGLVILDNKGQVIFKKQLGEKLLYIDFIRNLS